MSSLYLLPCECGQTTPIQLSQAGQQVRCGCGRSLMVPTMRGIRELKPADAAPVVTSKRTWNPTRGLVFGIGAISIVIGLIVFGFNFPNYRQAAAFKPTAEDMEATLAMIDQSSPEELWNMWHDASHHGMGEHEASIFVRARAITRYLQTRVIAGIVLFGIGVICVTAPLVIPSRQSNRQSE